MSTISPNSALVYTMVIVSASDCEMTDSEMKRIGDVVRILPAFKGYDQENIMRDARNCAAILSEDDGLEAVLGLIKEALPSTHLDTAYALACEIALADSKVAQEELRMLQIIRKNLGIDNLTTAAIERAATARARAF